MYKKTWLRLFDNKCHNEVRTLLHKSEIALYLSSYHIYIIIIFIIIIIIIIVVIIIISYNFNPIFTKTVFPVCRG